MLVEKVLMLFLVVVLRIVLRFLRKAKLVIILTITLIRYYLRM